MSRSRSSFDIASAIASATSLSTSENNPDASRGVNLVTFTPNGPSVRSAYPPASEAPTPAPMEEQPARTEAARRPPKLPDLSGVESLVERCRKILEWLCEAIEASEVFIADAAGLPIATTGGGIDARMATAGLTAATIVKLAETIPGQSAALFELHMGEGPFFQLIGFSIGGSRYLVGFMRATPLTYRQAHAVRLACWHALGNREAGASP